MDAASFVMARCVFATMWLPLPPPLDLLSESFGSTAVRHVHLKKDLQNIIKKIGSRKEAPLS